MRDDPVRLRPIEEADLDLLSRFDTDPAASQPFEWPGFGDPGARRRRWEQDGWIGRDSTQLAVALADGTLAGIVGWRAIKAGGPEGGCLEIGALLFPEHRGRGVGTAAQRLLVEYLFTTTLVNRLQAVTDLENLAEQRGLGRVGVRPGGCAARPGLHRWPLARRGAVRPAAGRPDRVGRLTQGSCGPDARSAARAGAPRTAWRLS